MFEKIIKVSINDFDVNPLYCVSLKCYIWQCGLKYTDIKLQLLQDKDKIRLLENDIKGGISSAMGGRWVKSDKNRKKLYIDANELYGHSTSQPLPYDAISFDTNGNLEYIYIKISWW